MITDYKEFLKTKDLRWKGQSGFRVESDAMSPHLFDYQRLIIQKSLQAGRYACFADTGLGKTAILLEWAKHVTEHTNGKVLIFTPLAVGPQIKREADKFGYEGVEVRRDGRSTTPITITNYDNMDKFDLSQFVGVVLDESSILKSFGSKAQKQLTERCAQISYKLCCTATPSPNDLIEIVNHSVFLGIQRFMETRALFFTTADSTVQKWRLKRHAVKDFWRWVGSWSIAIRRPEDLGFNGDSHVLPPLEYIDHTIATEYRADGELFAAPALGLKAQRDAKRAAMPERIAAVAKLVNETPGQWLVWCELNSESEQLHKAIEGSVEVAGRHSDAHKELSALNFIDGKTRVLISKPRIFGFGMNFQNCHQVAFCGLTHSFEQTYQAIRRCWRFGQKSAVGVHIFQTDAESAIYGNIQRKQLGHDKMFAEIVKNYNHRAVKNEANYRLDVASGTDWTLYLGDSNEQLDQIQDNSIHHSVFSPPFPAMYAYTDRDEDIGNSKDMDQLVEHLSFIMRKLYDKLIPGRIASLHLTQIPLRMTKDGQEGRVDFRGKTIEMMQDVGFQYWSEVTIDKNPQYTAIRTKDRGLLFKSLATDASVMTPALADYLLFFRKPGKNPIPIHAGESEKYNAGGGWITQQEWIEWAAPVWYREYANSPYPGIRQSDVLNVAMARSEDDELHLCPLQLGVIERSVKLYTNPGETVLSPFAGIGSEGYKSLLLNRKFIGIELRPEYWEVAKHNLDVANSAKGQIEIGFGAKDELRYFDGYESVSDDEIEAEIAAATASGQLPIQVK